MYVAKQRQAPIAVLLVDDHQIVLDGLSCVFSNEPDLDVVAVTTRGADASELASRLCPQVVVVDHHTPDLDGMSVLRSLASSHPTIKVIMLTASTDARTLLAAVEAGCAGFVTKDRPATELVSAIRAAVVGEAVISPTVFAELMSNVSRLRQPSGVELSERECEVLLCMARGLSNKAIAEELQLSVNTIRNYVQALLVKLDAHTKLEAVAHAVRDRVIAYPRTQQTHQ